MSGTEITLGELRLDFPGWAFEFLPGADRPWEARRSPSAFPRGGGVSWICAETSDRLRELVGGVLQIEAQLVAEEAAKRLRTLGGRLAVTGFEVKPAASSVAVTVPAVHGTPRPAETVVCRPRPEDRNRLWFFTEGGVPIAEADRITDALVFLTGHLRPTRAAL